VSSDDNFLIPCPFPDIFSANESCFFALYGPGNSCKNFCFILLKKCVGKNENSQISGKNVCRIREKIFLVNLKKKNKDNGIIPITDLDEQVSKVYTHDENVDKSLLN